MPSARGDFVRVEGSEDVDNGPRASEELLLFIERIERLEEDKKGIADDIKDVKSEAKSRGFDVPTINAIIKLRKKSPEQRREEEALLDTYKAALGMLDGTPLGKWAVERLKKNDDPDPEAQQAPEATDDAAPLDDDEAFYQTALRLVAEHQKASTSWLQRQFQIGYNKAAALIERMQREGHIGPLDQLGRREVLVQPKAGDQPPQPAEPEEPPLTVDDARRMGTEAAAAGQPVTSNPFPAFDERRAAWDEAWCSALGSDGMDIPDALKPAPKAKKSDPVEEQAD